MLTSSPTSVKSAWLGNTAVMMHYTALGSLELLGVTVDQHLVVMGVAALYKSLRPCLLLAQRMKFYCL